MGVIGGVGGYHVTVDSVLMLDRAVNANMTNVSYSGWEPIEQNCDISVYTVTADCQFRSENPAFTVVHLKCTLFN